MNTLSEVELFERLVKLAEEALGYGEVPVAAAVAKRLDRGYEVVAYAANMVERQKSQTRHAEIVAIEQAGRALGGWRLEGCDLFVTLEPCSMCFEAARLSRISTIHYLTRSDKFTFTASAGRAVLLEEFSGDAAIRGRYKLLLSKAFPRRK